ncbi:MAG: aldo/keto reductase [Parachlamydiales bacterium]|jgi:diketogulonate reductase-like aldo/keto reductase
MKNIPLIGPMPAIGLGTWRLNGKQCEETIKIALDLGYRHIDTADVYENHAAVGAGIQKFPREKLFLVSKIINDELQPQNVKRACERILKELNTPYLDLLLIHWPSKDIPINDTLEAMSELIPAHLVKYIGISNFMKSHLESIQRDRFHILTNQIEMHPFLQEKELVDYCQKIGVIVTAYRPIAKGIISENDTLLEIGERYHKTPVQVALRWFYQKGVVTIPKAGSENHLLENISIFDFELSESDMKSISGLETGMRLVNR